MSAPPSLEETMKDSKLTTAALLCAATLLAAVGSPAVAAPTLLTTTNATWRVTAAAPGAGWNSSASFDDSAWQSATVLYDVADYIGASYAGTQGIWSQAGQFSTTDTEIWTRTVFNLGAVPQTATLEYGIDDDGDLFVNGHLVAADHNGSANNGFADIGAYLVAGDNVIAMAATDNFPVWGYQHSAWIRVEGTVAAVPEPSTWAMLGLGLGAMGFMHRRRTARQ